MSPRTRNKHDFDAMMETIKLVARKQMAAEGTSALSLRAIAREMEVTAPALYRYFPNRDELITALILDAYNALADSLAASDKHSESGNYAARMRAVLLAYRAWALQHPTDFQLIFGNPIPNYEAPAEVTLPAARRNFETFIRILSEALEAGMLRLSSDNAQVPPAVEPYLQAVAQHEGYTVPLYMIYIATVGWSRIHGMIMLELFDHTQPIVGDTEAFYRYEIESLIGTMFG